MVTKFKKVKATGGRVSAFSKSVTKSGPTAPPIPADVGSRVVSKANDPLKQQG